MYLFENAENNYTKPYFSTILIWERKRIRNLHTIEDKNDSPFCGVHLIENRLIYLKQQSCNLAARSSLSKPIVKIIYDVSNLKLTSYTSKSVLNSTLSINQKNSAALLTTDKKYKSFFIWRWKIWGRGMKLWRLYIQCKTRSNISPSFKITSE